MLSSIEILILAIIQGVSEFLPVSSAAHTILISKYFNFNNQNLLVDICLHLGSLIAIIFYFRKDLFNFIKNKNFLIKIVIGTVPIVPVGFILYKTGLINNLRNLEMIAWMSLEAPLVGEQITLVLYVVMMTLRLVVDFPPVLMHL